MQPAHDHEDYLPNLVNCMQFYDDVSLVSFFFYLTVTVFTNWQRLMLRMLEDSFHKQDPIVCPGYDAELHQVWKVGSFLCFAFTPSIPKFTCSFLGHPKLRAAFPFLGYIT